LVLGFVEPDITEVESQRKPEKIFPDFIFLVATESHFKCGVDGGILVGVYIAPYGKTCSKREGVLG
jgi:hypothetical protein